MSNTQSTLLALVTIAAIAHYLMVSRRQGVLTLDGIFAVSQWIMAAGTLVHLNPSISADRLYAWVIAVPAIVYICVSIFVYLGRRQADPAIRTQGLSRVDIIRPTPLLLALLALSAIIAFTYYVAVGYNVLLLGLQQTGADYTTLRLDSYSGSRYLYPGYVNQFKNTILPLTLVVVAAYLLATRAPGRLIFCVIGIAGVMIAVLGTGQRGAFVQLVLTLVTFLYLLDRRRFRFRAVTAGLAALPPLLFTSSILGRSAASMALAGSPLGEVSVLLNEFGKRLFEINQFSGQVAFRYVRTRPIQDGRDWLVSILGVLPNNPGSTLPREVFAYLYGTDRGTAPPSMWGSVYYNFGLAGLVLGPIVAAIGFQLLTMKTLQRPDRNIVELLGISSFFVIMGNWVVGGPEYWLNAGAIASLLVWWLGTRLRSAPVVWTVLQSQPVPAGVIRPPERRGPPYARGVV